MTEQQIYDLIFNENDLSWQSLLMDVVKEENLYPWDIYISKLVKGYVDTVKKMKNANLRISGKVVLAAGLLLKVKSKRFVEHEMIQFDNLLKSAEQQQYVDDDFADIDLLANSSDEKTEYPLYPRMPQPRKRKVSIYDLVEALDKAMGVRQRRIDRRMPYARQRILIPDAKDIEGIIVTVYDKIRNFFKKNKQDKLTFSKLVPGDDKDSRLFTFIPLLHLSNERRVDLKQETHFGEIEVSLIPRKG